MTANETLKRLSECKPELRRLFHVRDLAIFGSVARSEAKLGSDLDVLVTFEGLPNFDDYSGLKLHLEKLFDVKVDLAISSDLKPALRPRIEREAIHVP